MLAVLAVCLKIKGGRGCPSLNPYNSPLEKRRQEIQFIDNQNIVLLVFNDKCLLFML